MYNCLALDWKLAPKTASHDIQSQAMEWDFALEGKRGIHVGSDSSSYTKLVFRIPHMQVLGKVT